MNVSKFCPGATNRNFCKCLRAPIQAPHQIRPFVAAREAAHCNQHHTVPNPKVEVRATREALFVSQIFLPCCHATSLFYSFLMNKFQSVLLPKECTLLWNTIYQALSI